MAHWKKRETTFSEYGTRFSLPGAWQLRPSDDPRRWFYRSSDKREQLTVSNSDLEGYDIDAEIHQATVKARRAVELGYKRFADFEMSEVETGEHQGIPEAVFSGSAGGDDHRFCMWMLFHEGQLWSFLYEIFRHDEAGLHARMEVLRTSLSFESERLTGRRKR